MPSYDINDLTIDVEKLQLSQLEHVLRQISSKIEKSRINCNCPSVLMVEDDEFVRLLNKTTIKELGFEFKEAHNGRIAVEAFIEQEKCKLCEGFLIVLMDYDMPEMNGVEVSFKEGLLYVQATLRIKELVKEGLVRDAPIIAVSAFVAS